MRKFLFNLKETTRVTFSGVIIGFAYILVFFGLALALLSECGCFNKKETSSSSANSCVQPLENKVLTLGNTKVRMTGKSTTTLAKAANGDEVVVNLLEISALKNEGMQNSSWVSENTLTCDD